MNTCHRQSSSQDILGEQLLQSVLTSRVSHRSGVAPETAELVIKAFLDELLASAREGGWSPALYRRLRFRPISDTHAATLHADASAAEPGPGVAMSFTEEYVRNWQPSLMPAAAPHHEESGVRDRAA